jgi:N-acetyl-gamma-glutamyl-phosphate reductase
MTVTHASSSAPASGGPIRVAIAGATGFAGQELVKLLVRHPVARLTVAMSSAAGSPTRHIPALTRIWDDPIVPLDLERLCADADVVFLALPEAASAEVGAALVARGLRVIDLSGAFRLRDDQARHRHYPATATLPEGTIYGLAEHDRRGFRDARLISCPGCYPTAALIALQPLAAAGLLVGPVIVDAKSGISGAGKTPSDRTHFSENHGSVAAYGLFSHRHTPEIEQELGHAVTFVPHLVPLDRGILETIYGTLAAGTKEADVSAALHAAYADAPFVRLVGSHLPEVKHVAHTNFCDVGWKVDEHTGRIILISCLDNLVKGAAGQAIQNFNLAVGLDERTGLL